MDGGGSTGETTHATRDDEFWFTSVNAYAPTSALRRHTASGNQRDTGQKITLAALLKDMTVNSRRANFWTLNLFASNPKLPTWSHKLERTIQTTCIFEYHGLHKERCKNLNPKLCARIWYELQKLVGDTPPLPAPLSGTRRRRQVLWHYLSWLLAGGRGPP